MIPIVEIQRRADTGPVMKSDEFDLAFSRKVREVVAKHAIKWNREELVIDDATADRVYQAGVELLVGVGLYHMDTQRVIQFSKEELEQIAQEIREGPRAVTFGTGEEEVCYQYRTSEAKRPVVLAQGAAGGASIPVLQEWFIQYAQSYAQEELNLGQGLTGGVAIADGVTAKTGAPSEAYVGLWESKALLEACRRAGRPGMHLGIPIGVTSLGGVLALVTSGLRGRHNMQIAMHIMPELKIDWTRLMFAFIAERSGIVPWTSAISLMGALSRGPEDTAVGTVANWLGQFAYGHGLPAFIWLSNMYGECSLREILWANSAALRAAERNICMPTGCCTSPEERYTGSELSLYWQAASAIMFSSSGAAFSPAGGHTGLETRLNGEVFNAVAGIERGKANQLIEGIYAKFEAHRAEPSVPKLFPELYDVNTIQPKPEHLAAYQRVKEGLARLGVPFN